MDSFLLSRVLTYIVVNNICSHSVVTVYFDANNESLCNYIRCRMVEVAVSIV